MGASQDSRLKTCLHSTQLQFRTSGPVQSSYSKMSFKLFMAVLVGLVGTSMAMSTEKLVALRELLDNIDERGINLSADTAALDAEAVNAKDPATNANFEKGTKDMLLQGLKDTVAQVKNGYKVGDYKCLSRSAKLKVVRDLYDAIQNKAAKKVINGLFTQLNTALFEEYKDWSSTFAGRNHPKITADKASLIAISKTLAKLLADDYKNRMAGGKGTLDIDVYWPLLKQTLKLEWEAARGDPQAIALEKTLSKASGIKL